jgi:hypothetical protein
MNWIIGQPISYLLSVQKILNKAGQLATEAEKIENEVAKECEEKFDKKYLEVYNSHSDVQIRKKIFKSLDEDLESLIIQKTRNKFFESKVTNNFINQIIFIQIIWLIIGWISAIIFILTFSI